MTFTIKAKIVDELSDKNKYTLKEIEKELRTLIEGTLMCKIISLEMRSSE